MQSSTTTHYMIDSHCHFDFAQFDEKREALWQQCQQLAIQKLIIPGTEPTQWQKAQAISTRFQGIYSACGLHPWFITTQNQQQLNANLTEFIQQHPSVVAIGECGLDKYAKTDFAQQQHIFIEHIQLAIALDLPLIIHVRDCHNEVIRILKRSKPTRGVIHAFSGSLAIAQSYCALGFSLGIGGTITYARARKTRHAVQQLPLTHLLLETDAPDMPLSGMQGMANTPCNLPTIATTLATLKQLPLATVMHQTTQNTEQLFAL